VRRRGGLSLAGPERLRSVLTLVGVLLIAAGTQVIPQLPVAAAPVTSVVAGLPSVPFEERIEANLERLRGLGGDGAAAFQMIVEQGRQLLHFEPDDNRGRGSWAELVGVIDEHTEAVGVLVPGSAAFVLHDNRDVHDNFERYHQRAADLVEESEGRLAMVVWADGTFPQGWIQGALARYHRPLGEALAQFTHELRAELDSRLDAGPPVPIVVAGHSFGGAVVGAAELYGMDADVVLHIASAGMGQVRDPYDYPEPERPRYSMTAPGDLIGFVQGAPAPPWLGHGPDPDDFRCVGGLATGSLPADPNLRDELGDPLGERAGSQISGFSSHSDVFIRYSDAWWQIYRVFMGREPAIDECPLPEDLGHLHARVLPLVVPRVITDSQCRAGGGLRPADRRRLLKRLSAAG
jgi:hypothetical protein